ncbi:VanW family protein [Pontibacillus yanchengensis]|uniref:G5 domain-containing protein n=1 Tax=Pontibacillus yanchengensis Y32 TaxID=1385514 RepID=A0A0A2THM3_9BACI|nr:VanW family protein [Pontibacillus yanchengensis]KGP73923.1 hypothetical protein N782_21215 [Pontibacillus yanchengensis Y32]
MGKQLDIKLFILLTTMAVFLIAMSVSGNFIYQTVLAEPETYDEGTSVSGVQLSGLTKAEAKIKLQNAASEWIKKHPVLINMKQNQLTFPPSLFDFNIEKTLKNIKYGESTKISININVKEFSSIENELGPNLYDKLLLQSLNTDLKNTVESLPSKPIEFSIYDYVEKGTVELYETVSKYSIPIPNGIDPSYYIRVLDGVTVNAKETFSLLKYTNDASFQSSEALNLVASAILGSSLKTNFSIKERHISQHRPEYIPRGREASINPEENQGFEFVNINESNYKLTIYVQDGNLIAKWKGYPLPSNYKVAIKGVQEIQPKTIVNFSNKVVGTEIIKEGSKGEVYELHRLTVNQNNQVISNEFIAEDYYSPLHRVELHYKKKDYNDNDEDITQEGDTDSNIPTSSSSLDSQSSSEHSSNSEEDQNNQSSPNDSKSEQTNQSEKQGVVTNPEDMWDQTDEPSKGE